MLKVKSEDAVGMVLCHDITKIVPGEFKGAAYKKGHVVTASDIAELLKLGKEYLYVWECDENHIHEDEAAIRISRAVAGKNIEFNDPEEGKVTLVAAVRGLLKINVETLRKINNIPEVVAATRHNNSLVEHGETVAGARVIPLIIDKGKIERVEQIAGTSSPIIEIIPLKPLKIGIITTGNEVFSGRIQDRFGPIVINKINNLGCITQHHILLPDSSDQVSAEIKEMVKQGCEMVIVTGGMSVDPDDATPWGIKRTGAKIITYGTPLFPGAMLMLAYLDEVPVIGLPGCVMYSRATVFDVILPRILAGEKITRQDLTNLGHGGLCLDCPECHFPNCTFGKG